MDGCILRVYGVDKSFFGAPVPKNVQLEALPGEVHVLLGENRAGKSALTKILSGVYGRGGGDIWLDGRELASMVPKEVLDAGTNVIYQEFNLVPDLLMYENILTGKEYGQGVLVDHKRTIREMEGYMKWVGLRADPRTLVRELGVAQKQLVEVAKAISNHVKILVLGEPTAAIMDEETNMLLEIIWEPQEGKIGIIYISHRMSELFKTGDRCMAMRDGECIGTIRLSKSPEGELTGIVVGRMASLEKTANETADMNQVVLKVENPRYKDFLKGISFKLYKDEILGSAGLVGAGRTEVTKCMIGAYRGNGGAVTYKGETSLNSLSRNVERGTVYPSEDRGDEGLTLVHSVMDNIALPSLKRLAEPFIRKKEMADRIKDYIRSSWVRTHIHLTKARNLSGRSQQKIVIAKWLYSNANVHIFDESTRGVDMRVRDEICNIMYDPINQGAPTIMISSDLVEVLKMHDRVAVIREGVLEAILDNDLDLIQGTISKHAMQGGMQVWRVTKMVLGRSRRL